MRAQGSYLGPNFATQSEPRVGMWATTALPPAALMSSIARKIGSGSNAIDLRAHGHTQTRLTTVYVT